MELAAIFRDFAHAAATAAVTALWQGAALALGLALCLRLAPCMSARDRFRVWAAGFATVAMLPFLPWVLSLCSAAAGASGVVSAAGAMPQVHPWPHALLDLDSRWCLAIAGVWLIASLARFADLVVHSFRLRGLWKRAVPLADFAEAKAVDFWFGQRPVEVCTTREVDRPSVIGFFRPRILIPEWLLERLTPAELDQVVMHEAEHLRRRDDWTNLLQKLSLVVFPLNPALAWMERRLCREREMACDEGVLRRTHSPRAYAACLASLAERRIVRRAEALSLGAWRRRPELAERVHRILRRGPGLHPMAARALLGVVSCGLVAGSVELAQCPQLVAFAARPAVQQDMADAVLRDGTTHVGNAPAYVARNGSMGGFHAVNAVARVPSRAELATEGKRLRRSRNFASNETRRRKLQEMSPSTPAAIAASAQDGGKIEEQRIAANAESVPQQLVVLTAWEQVESVAAPGQNATAADASADVARAEGHAAVAESTAGPVARQRSGAPQYIVTRLVLQIYPVRMTKAGASSGTNIKTHSKPGSATDPKSTPMQVPLARVPVSDGWLVLQL